MFHRPTDETQILHGAIAQGDGLSGLLDMGVSYHHRANIMFPVGVVKYFV